MKIEKFYLFTVLYCSCFAGSLHSQEASFSDKELLKAFLQGQKERDEAFYFLITKILSGMKNGKISIDIENSLNNSNTTTTNTDVKTESISRVTQDLYQYTQEKLPTAYNSIPTYISLAGYMQYQYYSVCTKQGWMHWCKHLELSELLSSNIDTLTEKLVQDVNIQYLNKENVHDLILPHTTFINAIDDQINAASNYIYYYEMLNSCRIAPLFGLRQTSYTYIKDAHTRLIFIKNLFITWLSQQHS